jgi:hypothetical protein
LIDAIDAIIIDIDYAIITLSIYRPHFHYQPYLNSESPKSHDAIVVITAEDGTHTPYMITPRLSCIHNIAQILYCR